MRTLPTLTLSSGWLRLATLSVSLVAASTLSSCAEDETALNEPPKMDMQSTLPIDFPAMHVPADNPITAAKVELGRHLFYETRMSRDNSTSCGSCHQASAGFADSAKSVSNGVFRQTGRRNAPGLANVAYNKVTLWDGRKGALEEQALAPIFDPVEFSGDSATIKATLSQDTRYQQLFTLAYGDATVTMDRIAKAISTFERTMVSGNSAFDLFNRGNKSALSASAKRGMELFNSKEVNCVSCHEGHNFTDDDFHSTGLEQFYDDEGRFFVTRDRKDHGKFKTPSLRNVGLTAPYMHNGRFATLKEVMHHYNEGGKPSQNRDSLMKPLNLTNQQIDDIIEFLKSLTDHQFIADSRFSNPWKQ